MGRTMTVSEQIDVERFLAEQEQRLARLREPIIPPASQSELSATVANGQEMATLAQARIGDPGVRAKRAARKRERRNRRRR